MEELHKQAEQLRNKLRSYLDDPHHPRAQAVVNEVDRLITDIRGQKHPISLENRIKEVIKILESFVDDTIMDFRHRDELIKQSNNMRSVSRSLS